MQAVHITSTVLHSGIAALSIYIAVLYFGYLVVTRVYSAFWGPLSKFPGPKLHALTRIPFIRTTFLGRDNIDIPALHREYGDVVRTGPNQLSFVGNPRVWKDVYGFKKNGRAQPHKDPEFYGHPINKVPGLITADDAMHSRQRKIVSHAFSDKALKEQEPMLKTWATKLKDKLVEQANASTPVDMLKMLNCTTFDIMGDLTFAEPLHMLDNSEYVPWVKTIFQSIRFATFIRAIKMLSVFAKILMDELVFRLPIFRRKATEHWKYTSDRVDRRLGKTPDRPDLWSRILEKSKGGEGLSLQEHYSIASLFMVAGTETTATALSGTLYYLIKNPEYLKKVQQELRDNFASIEDLTLDGLQRQRYLGAVLNEGLRMYPPVPLGLPRVVPSGGAMVGDQLVPESTKILVHNLATYRSESNFKDPYEFHPERWLNDERYKDDVLESLEPFSVGPRNCLGKNLAWHEMRLLLSTVLLHFDFSLNESSHTWADQKVYTLWEKRPLMCTIDLVVA